MKKIHVCENHEHSTVIYDMDKCPFCDALRMVAELSEKIDELELDAVTTP